MMGKTFKFIHCADLHLGARFKGLSSIDSATAERLRSSVFDSFSRIIDKAIENRVDALIISGDLYDDSNELPSTRIWLSQQLSRLSIPVLICRGNHDSSTSWDYAIDYPENVHVFGTEPESIHLGDDVEIIGASFAEQHETRNLATLIQGDPDRFTIGCIHCDIESVTEGYSYSPCTVSDLRGRSVDYWALGHIHKRNVVSEEPYIVYSGNIQGRSFKETGPKGAYLVTINSKKVTGLDFISTQGYIWKDIKVDITGREFNSVMAELRTLLGRSTIARITFTGTGNLDAMLRTSLEDVSRSISETTGAIVSSIELRTSPAIDLDSRAKGKDMGSAIIRSGRDMEALSKEDIVDIICDNKVLSKYRSSFMSMSEEEIKSIIEDAMKGVLARMEVSR